MDFTFRATTDTAPIFSAGKNLAEISGQSSTLLCHTSRGNFISTTPRSSFRSGRPILSARCRTVGHAARPPLLAARRAFAGRRHYAPCTCSQGGLHLTITSFARPAPNRAFPGRTAVSLCPTLVRLRRPYSKENYSPRALQRTEFIIYRIRPRSPADSAESARGANLFLIIFLELAGGRRNYKTPARRPLLRPPGWSFLLLIYRHRREQDLPKPWP